MSDSPSLWIPQSIRGNSDVIVVVTQSPWNMALTVGNGVADSVERRRNVCEAIGVQFDKLTVTQQVHRDGIFEVDNAMMGKGRDRSDDRLEGVDGMVTTIPGVPLMVLGADCCLVAVWDSLGRAVGVVHAGWRGTSLQITTKLVERVAALSDASPEKLQAAISPCAKSCCYEVGPEVVDASTSAGLAVDSVIEHRDGKTFLDVEQANRMQLINAGIMPKRIESANVCTICDDRYYSYRRTGSTVGQHALIAAIRPQPS